MIGLISVTELAAIVTISPEVIEIAGLPNLVTVNPRKTGMRPVENPRGEKG
jgi:hypothetical protein